MRFILPAWLKHGRDARSPSAVFSVDIQPHGFRLATGGQDAAVNIWSLDVLDRLAQPHSDDHLDNGDESQNNEPASSERNSQAEIMNSGRHANVAPDGALLASVTGHAAAVNCVRWSPQGTLLASGGDDAVVLIYERCAGEGRSAAFGGGMGGAENWRVRRPLRAHEADVTDVCWSPDGERIASASVDNTIGIWSVRAENLIARLKGHNGLVKGVAWDPVGHFLASQSDDRSAIVWRTSDWKPDKVLTDPFEAAIYPQNSNVFYLRCSWSPCGSQLLTTNGLKRPTADIAAMFSRTSGFEHEIDLVGHKQPVVASRFSPRLYRYRSQAQGRSEGDANGDPGSERDMGLQEHDPRSLQRSEHPNKQHTAKSSVPLPESAQSPPYTCLALGSKDAGASVWQAKSVRPFFNMRDIFSQEVIDISWGSDGYTLVACSPDGNLLYVKFEPSELGNVVPFDEEREIFAKIWRQFGGPRDGAPLPETPAQFAMENSRRLEQQRSSKEATTVRTAVAVLQSGSEKVLAAGTTQTQSASQQQQQLAIVKVPMPGASGSAGVVPTPPAGPDLLASQKEIRARGGKRRIIPAAVAPVSATNDQNRIGSNQVSYGPNSMEVPSSLPADSQMEQVPKKPRIDDTLVVVDGPNEHIQHSALKSANAADHIPESGIATARTSNVRADRNHGVETVENRNAIPAPQPPLYKPSIVGLSMMLLPETGSSSGPVLCKAIDERRPPTLLESREQHGSSRGGAHVLSCSRGGEVKWHDYLPSSSAVTLLAGVAEKFAAVATADGLLLLYSARSGKRLTPPIALDSAAHILEAFAMRDELCNGGVRQDNERWYSLLVTRSGLCVVHDVKRKKMVCARSAAPLIARVRAEGSEKDEADNTSVRVDFFRSISQVRVTSKGEPILVFSDGHVFFYSSELCSWLRIADDSTPNSEFIRTVPSSPDVGIVRSLQANASTSRHLPSLSGMGDLRRAAVETLSHLECLLESSLALSSPKDYRYFLSCYAAKLTTAGDDDVENCDVRARELCDDLLRVGASTAEDRLILGMDSRDLLREIVLPVFSSNTRMQRLVSEYIESMNEFKSSVTKINTALE